MDSRPRIYDAILAEHLQRHRQMAFITGPRQVGKTTTCRALAQEGLNWDNADDRKRIVAGPSSVAHRLGLDRLHATPPVAMFDELHKYPRWKSFLKGFYDTYADSVRLMVTGSSRMDIYRRGGDSLMGRYFLYRMHPFTAAEAIRQDLPDAARIARPPAEIDEADWQALWMHGGYPEPFLKRDIRFTRRWRSLRQQLLLREDIRDLTRVHELGQLELLVSLLMDRSSSPLVYSNLAQQVGVTIDTIRRWITTLCGFHVGFLVRPWFKNVSRSLRKEPKWFLRDWSGVADEGRRVETFIACHLLKAVEGWTDLGFGDFQLCYLRDTQKREADFVVIRDQKPWMIVEAKKSEAAIDPSLRLFQDQIRSPLAFQVVFDAEFVDADCFARSGAPLAVPAKTFLSQLL